MSPVQSSIPEYSSINNQKSTINLQSPINESPITRSPSQRIWLTLAIVLMALVIGYFDVPRDLQDHSHWAKVAWVPFADRPFLPRDVVLNILLFVPLGVLTRWRFPARPGLCLLIGLALALGAEGSQVFSHGRVPSLTDVTCNMIGTAAGIIIARLRAA